MLLDVVYNHVGASGTAALRAFGPYFTSHYETPWGEAINYDDEYSDAVREWALQSAEQWVRDFHLDGLRLDAVHAIKDSNPEHLVAAVARRTEPAFVIAESGLNDPKVMRDRGRLGLRRRVGRRLPPRAARAAHRRPRGLLRASSARVADLAKAFHRPHVHDGTYSTFRHRRFGAKADHVPAERFVVFSSNHDQVGNRAFGDRLPVEVAAAGRAVHAAVAVHADALPGRGVRRATRRSSSSPTTSTRRSRTPRARAAGASSPPSPSSAGAEVPDPQDPATFAASKLTRAATGGLRELYAQLLRGAPRAAGRRRRTTIAFDEHAGWLRVHRGAYALLANFSRRDTPRAARRRPPSWCWPPSHATLEPGYVVLPALSGALVRLEVSAVQAVWPGRPFPLGAAWDGDGTNFSLFSEHAERVELCLFDEDDDEDADRAHASARRSTGTATCRASVRASATATACTGRTTRASGHRFNPAKLLIDPYAKSIEGKVRWDRGERAPVRRRSRTPATTPISSATTRTPRSRSPSAW